MPDRFMVTSAADLDRLIDLGEAVTAWAQDHELILADAQCALGVLAIEWRPDA